jgi:hypothetical protein
VAVEDYKLGQVAGMLVGLIVLKRYWTEVAELGKTLLHNFAGDVHICNYTRAFHALVEVEISRKTEPRLNVLLNCFKGEILDEPTGLAAVDVGHAVVIFLVEVQDLRLILALVLQPFFQNLAVAAKVCVFASFRPFENLSIRHVKVNDVAGHHSALGHKSGLDSRLGKILKDPTMLTAVATFQSFAQKLDKE